MRHRSDKAAWEYAGTQKAISEAAEVMNELVGQCISLGTWQWQHAPVRVTVFVCEVLVWTEWWRSRSVFCVSSRKNDGTGTEGSRQPM